MLITQLKRGMILMCFIASMAWASSDEIIEITQADMYYSGTQGDINKIHPIWTPTTLPFSQPGDSDRTFYWFLLPIDEAAGSEALYIQNQVFDMQVFLNGYAIGGTARLDHKVAMGWNHPFYIDLLPMLWKEQGNTLMLRIGNGEPNVILSPILFGDKATLLPIYEKKYFQQVTVAQWSLIACVLMGTLILFIWLWRKHDTKFFYFACICFTWSVVMTYLSLPYAPFDHGAWLRLGYICVDLSALLTVLFINRTFGFDHAKLERILWSVFAVSAFVLAVMPMHWHVVVMSTTHFLQFLFIAFVVGKVFMLAIKEKQPAALWMVGGFAIMALIMFRDIAVFWVSYQLPQRLPESTFMQFGFGALLIVIFIYLIKTFVDALQESEYLNRELENKVKRISKSLEQSYSENRALELRASAQQEREKIYRDLHDDVGAKLVSIIHSGGDELPSQMAREALVSLREVVSQNSFQYQHLSVLMVSSIGEMETRLDNAQITFTNQGIDSLPDLAIIPEVGYHISRIIREVTTNIIKHANASAVCLATEFDEKGRFFALSIRDDGRGISPSAEKGNGIANIRFRADKINADVMWSLNDPRGTHFSLKCIIESMS